MEAYANSPPSELLFRLKRAEDDLKRALAETQEVASAIRNWIAEHSTGSAGISYGDEELGEAATFVNRLVAFADSRAAGTQGWSYLLVWYARRSLQKGRPIVHDQIAQHLSPSDLADLQTADRGGWVRLQKGDSLKNIACRLAHDFREDLSSEDRKKWNPWVLGLLPADSAAWPSLYHPSGPSTSTLTSHRATSTSNIKTFSCIGILVVAGFLLARYTNCSVKEKPTATTTSRPALVPEAPLKKPPFLTKEPEHDAGSGVPSITDDCSSAEPSETRKICLIDAGDRLRASAPSLAIQLYDEARTIHFEAHSDAPTFQRTHPPYALSDYCDLEDERESRDTALDMLAWEAKASLYSERGDFFSAAIEWNSLHSWRRSRGPSDVRLANGHSLHMGDSCNEMARIVTLALDRLSGNRGLISKETCSGSHCQIWTKEDGFFTYNDGLYQYDLALATQQGNAQIEHSAVDLSEAIDAFHKTRLTRVPHWQRSYWAHLYPPNVDDLVATSQDNKMRVLDRLVRDSRAVNGREVSIVIHQEDGDGLTHFDGTDKVHRFEWIRAIARNARWPQAECRPNAGHEVTCSLTIEGFFRSRPQMAYGRVVREFKHTANLPDRIEDLLDRPLKAIINLDLGPSDSGPACAHIIEEIHFCMKADRTIHPVLESGNCP